MARRKRNQQQYDQQQGRQPARGRRQSGGRQDMPRQGHKSSTTMKKVKPIGAGKAFALGLLAAFIIFLLAATALIFVSRMQAQQEQAAFDQTVTEALDKLHAATVDVSFSPADEVRKKVLDPSANISVAKNATPAAPETPPAPEQPAPEGEQPAPEGEAPAPEGEQQPAPEGEAAPVEQSAGEGEYAYGAGVVINSDGYILTNYHVVESQRGISVCIGGKDYDKVDVVGFDETSDLAVIKVDAKDLPVAQFGKSADVQPGDWTMSVGNPYNLNDSMSTGVVSALDRNFTYPFGQTTIIYANMLQTTSALNEGCSGGGLYNSSGELIGINTLISVDEASSDRIGYAIPVDYALPIAKALMAKETPAHASMGLTFEDVPADDVAKYGLPDSDGALVSGITPAGPGETAGISSRDIVVAFNGKPIKNAQSMLYKIRGSKIGESVKLTLLRGGQQMELTVKLGGDA